MWSGLLPGGFAAFFLALSYIFSGMSVRRNHRVGTLGLLCRAHIVMGVLAAIGLIFFWTPSIVDGFSIYIVPLVFSIFFYLLGQASLFVAQRTIDSSRVVPLLGLKLVILALLNVYIVPRIAFFGKPGDVYGIWQWDGIGMTLLSAALLNKAGRKIPLSGFMWVLGACTGYALSDTFIEVLVRRLRELGEATGEVGLMGTTRPAIVAAFLSYVLCGLVCLCLVGFFRIPKDMKAIRVWGWISPFAVCWLIAMLFLFTCFGRVGTVNGNIIQSSRGIIAILLGALLAKLGFTELEEKVDWQVFVRRLIAGALMIGAIAAFNYR
jgi:drug/metabolite transporter (DMT)-like permease